MGSRGDSSRGPVIRGFRGLRRIYAPFYSSYGLEEFGNAFVEPGGCFRKDIEELQLLPPLPDEHGIYQATIAPQYHPRLPAPQAPQTPVPNEMEAFFAYRFRELDLELEALRRLQAPLFVSEGRVATFSVVGMAAEGDAVFGSDLEVHVPADKAK